MLGTKIKLIIVLLCTVLVSSGCQTSVNEPPARDAAGRTSWYAESYIEVTPKPAKPEKPRQSYPDRADVALEPVRIEPQEVATAAAPSGRTPLAEETFADVTIYRIGDTNYYMEKPAVDNPNYRAAIQRRADSLNTLSINKPAVDYYAYYITRAIDGNWFEGYETFDWYGYLQECLGTDSRFTAGRYEINSLEEYYDTGYKTDFHVNYKGSRRVYEDLYAMLSASGRYGLSPVRSPTEEFDTGVQLVGDLFSEAAYDSVEWTEEGMDDFIVYRYDLPPYTSYLNDRETQLGMEEEYAEGLVSSDPRFGHQFVYYGGQTGVVRYEFDQPEQPNLLMISDSQGRPSRLPLASHFNTTIYLDSGSMRDTDLDAMIEAYDVGVVVYIGQRGMFELYG